MKVLVVEDEINARNFLIYLIKEFFFKINFIGTASSIAEAKNIIEEKHPDLVFLDIRLEDGTGFELLQQIKNIDFKVIFIKNIHCLMKML